MTKGIFLSAILGAALLTSPLYAKEERKNEPTDKEEQVMAEAKQFVPATVFCGQTITVPTVMQNDLDCGDSPALTIDSTKLVMAHRSTGPGSPVIRHHVNGNPTLQLTGTGSAVALGIASGPVVLGGSGGHIFRVMRWGGNGLHPAGGETDFQMLSDKNAIDDNVLTCVGPCVSVTGTQNGVTENLFFGTTPLQALSVNSDFNLVQNNWFNTGSTALYPEIQPAVLILGNQNFILANKLFGQITQQLGLLTQGHGNVIRANIVFGYLTLDMQDADATCPNTYRNNHFGFATDCIE